MIKQQINVVYRTSCLYDKITANNNTNRNTKYEKYVKSTQNKDITVLVLVSIFFFNGVIDNQCRKNCCAKWIVHWQNILNDVTITSSSGSLNLKC